ncbi:MAG: hypothetical protein DI534_05200 [Leifsonia xyli]|nr:MAG: hypothetical protein DI534_05200 [Leifsonia xyli]
MTDNEQIRQKWLDGQSGENGEFVDAIGAQYPPLYAQATYIDDWQSRDDLQGDYNFNVDTNAHTLKVNLKTSDPKWGDEEGFHRNMSFNAAREVSDDGTTRVIEIDYTESNNADKNRVGVGTLWARVRPTAARSH